MSCAQHSISSNACDTAWRTRGLKGRSDPRVGTITELPSWTAIVVAVSSAASHTGS